MLKLSADQALFLRSWVGIKPAYRKDELKRKGFSPEAQERLKAELVSLKVFKVNKAGVVSSVLGYAEALSLVAAQGTDVESARKRLQEARAKLGNAEAVLRSTPRGTWPYDSAYEAALAGVRLARRELEHCQGIVAALS